MLGLGVGLGFGSGLEEDDPSKAPNSAQMMRMTIRTTTMRIPAQMKRFLLKALVNERMDESANDSHSNL